MATLADCLKKAGKALHGSDVQAIQDLVSSGMSEPEAVATHLANVDAELADIADRVEKAGGQVARAPESMTYDQSGKLMTDTPEFRAWFGDSKVVDENGAPLVVYHGTAADFEAFDTGKATDAEGRRLGMGWGQGKFYFADNSYGASNSAEYAPALGKGDAPNVLPVYLRIQNPISAKDYMARVQSATDTGIDRDAAIEQVDAEIRQEGFDGIVDTVSGGIAVFNPTQIKSVFNRGTFDPNDPRILYQGGFYSPVERAAEQLKQEKGSGQQFLAMLKKAPGVKLEELEWIGLDDYLAGQKSVTKQQVLDYIAQNKVSVEEVTLAEKDTVYKKGFDTREKLVAEIMDDPMLWQDGDLKDGLEIGQEPDGQWNLYDNRPGATRFSKYTLPGGENYREVLLTLPSMRKEAPLSFEQWLIQDQGFTQEFIDNNRPVIEESQRGRYDFYRTNYDSRADFKSAHFDQPNILAHLRLNDRTGPNGEKILFVEEIQSDWHQAGRKKGYGKRPKYAVFRRDGTVANKAGGGIQTPAIYESKADAEADVASRPGLGLSVREHGWMKQGVPDAPLKKTWHEMAFRRAVQMAAEGGYDTIAWTTGEQQAERYDLSKRVDAIDAWRMDEDRRLYDVNVRLKDGRIEKYSDQSESRLEDLVGEEIAQKIIEHQDGPDADQGVHLTGLDLKVSGKGMKGFYDKMIPFYANKFGKKFGAKVGETEINVAGGKPTAYADYAAYKAAQSEPIAVHSLPITDEMRESVKAGVPLFQTGEKPRAQIILTDAERIIQLGRASDLSSFLHESGHLFLEMEKHFARKFGVTEDQQKLLDWLGKKSFDEVTVDDHEKFAETFEAYLREGKAPSVGLKEAFAAFARWLTRIYQSLRSLPNADLSPEIVEVMDRMLATEEEIAQAQGSPAFEQFFRSKEQAGMTDAEWQKYQERVAKVSNKAAQTVDEKLFKEWRRVKTAEWKEEKAPLIDEEKERLSKEPVYAVLKDAADYPMDRDALKEILGVRKLPPRLNGRTAIDGEDPGVYAEVYGFPSVKAMVDAIVNAPTLNEAANTAAEARMVEKYGDILNDGTIEAEVLEAMHNVEHANLLLDEMRALQRKTNDDRVIDREFLKAEAKAIIQKMKFKEIRPDKYYRSEIRAAQKAATATDDATALEAKIQQLVNHYLYREAVQAKEDMQKQRRYVRKAQTREYTAGQFQPEYAQNYRTLANLYDMKSQPDQVQAIDKILNWYETQINDENQYVDISLLDENLVLALEARKRDELPNIRLPAFNDLTAGQLRGLYDMLRHMRYVGGQLSDEVKAKLQEVRTELLESIIENGGKDYRGRRGQMRPGEKTKRQVSHLINKIPSLRNLIRKLDGFNEDGVAHRIVYRLVEDANSRKLALHDEVFTRFESEMQGVHKLGLRNTGGTDYTLDSGLSINFTAEERFMLALYWGTETSREAIREGYGMTDADVARVLADMTDEQLDLVNATWRVNESMWPQLSSASVNLYGVAPPKLEATPFMVNGKKLTGGHMRLFYDSTELELKSEKEKVAKLSTIMPSKAASLNARVGSGGRPVSLDKSNIARALDESVHFIAFAEAGSRLRSILNARDVKAAIERKHGPGFMKALFETIDGITGMRTERESYPALATMMRLLRRAATFKHLAYSIRNTVQQFSAIPVAMEEVGIMDWMSAMARFATNHRDFVEFVNGRSQFMTNRASLVNREAAEFLRKIVVDGKAAHAWNVFASYGFTPQTIIDSMTSYPTWMAKYEQGMKEHGDDKLAASQADTAVAESVGSGADLHLGGAFQSNNSEFIRTFTIFGTWFNAYFQRMYKSTKGFTDFANVEAVKSLIITPFIVAVISAALIADGPDDDEEWYAWALKRYAAFMGGTLPIVRDAASVFQGYSPKTVYAGGSETPARFYTEFNAWVEGRRTPLKGVSNLAKITTTVVPVPGADNFTRVLDYLDSYQRGKEDRNQPLPWKAYQAIVEGPNR